MTNEEKRALIMATLHSPPYIQAKVDKIINKKPLIDLKEIEQMTDYIPTYEEAKNIVEGKCK